MPSTSSKPRDPGAFVISGRSQVAGATSIYDVVESVLRKTGFGDD